MTPLTAVGAKQPTFGYVGGPGHDVIHVHLLAPVAVDVIIQGSQRSIFCFKKE